MNIIGRLIITAIAILATTYLIPGFVVTNFSAALIAAIVLSLLNVLVKPVLSLLTLPINILTLGLFTFILNALIFMLTAKLVTGFEISGIVPAILGSIVVSFISSLLSQLFKNKD